MIKREIRVFGAWCLAGLFLVGGVAPASAWAKKPGQENAEPNGVPGNGKKVKLSPELRKLEQLRQQMQVTDEAEWQALQGRLMKVMLLSKQSRDLRDAKSAMEGPKLPKKSEQGGAAPVYTYPAQVESSLIGLGEKAAAAQAELANPNARAADIQFRLGDFRRARAEADRLVAMELKKARDELRELVTPRQELTLVANGLLD